MNDEYKDVIIGLESHVQLTNLKTKFFCNCSSDYYGKNPNTHVCPGCLGFPGILPKINKKAIEFATRLAIALDCKINKSMYFFRKNYFYPDMARNFQLTLYNKLGGHAFADGGKVSIKINNTKKEIKLNRIHLEEDPARIIYKGSITTSPYALVDYNRSGITLIEVVTEPCMNSPEEAREYLNQLKSIIHYTGISNLNIEGTCRVDANISILGSARVEIKNINSFKEVERALKWEIQRQRNSMKRGKEIIHETRGWDTKRRITISMRTKEYEEDYRYFPEQDLVPLEIDSELIDIAIKELPEMPTARSKRFQEEYQLTEFDADNLVLDKDFADFFEESIELGSSLGFEEYKQLCNWLMGDISRWLNENNKDIKNTKLNPQQLVDLIIFIKDKKITGKIAKSFISDMMRGISVLDLLKKSGKKRIADEEKIIEIVQTVINENPQTVKDYKKNPKALQALIGKCMEKTRGQIDPEITKEIFLKNLKC